MTVRTDVEDLIDDRPTYLSTETGRKLCAHLDKLKERLRSCEHRVWQLAEENRTLRKELDAKLELVEYLTNRTLELEAGACETSKNS